MIEVRQGVFYGAIGGPESIHPRPDRVQTTWENTVTREVVGRSTPGYVGTGPHRYFLAPAFAARKGITKGADDDRI